MPENSRQGPRVYAKMLDAAYVALKLVRRSNVVIGGNSFTSGAVTPADWVRWMRLPNGRPPRLDWYGHNPFGPRYPKLSQTPYVPGIRDMSDVDTLYRAVKRTYRKIGRRPKLWLSKYSIPTERPDRAFDFFVSRADQARWLTAAFRIASRSVRRAGSVPVRRTVNAMARLAEASLSADERALVEAFVNELSARLDGALHAVWLFGSRARGERPRDEWSDVDLLVIADDASWEGRERVYAALDAAATDLGRQALSWSLSVHVQTPDWLAQRRAVRSFFIEEVDRDKVVLCGTS